MESKLTRGNIVKSLLVFTTPLILSGMFQQIFNWVDAFIVGNTEGELALAGIGATTSLYNFFVTIIIGFTSGLSVLAAQLFGKGEGEKLKSILSSFSGVLGGIFLTAAVLASLFTNEILVLLDTPANIFDAAKQYMQLLLIGIPFLAIYNLRRTERFRKQPGAVFICSYLFGYQCVFRYPLRHGFSFRYSRRRSSNCHFTSSNGNIYCPIRCPKISCASLWIKTAAL